MLAVGTWLLLCVTTVIGCIYLFKKLFFRKTRPGEPPIVKGNVIFGSSIDFGAHAVDFLHKCQRNYGEMFTIRLINQYLTIIMDPHSYEAMSKEKNFDFDPIQKQVNSNVFSFVLKEPKKMIKDTARTVRGAYLDRNMRHFSDSLIRSFDEIQKEGQSLAPGGEKNWTMGLRQFTSASLFDPLFTTIFGTSEKKTLFNWRDVVRNFEVFHEYFNYMWLGFPKKLFPAACKALGELLEQPSSSELLSRPDSSDYIKTAVQYMLDRGQTEDEIKGHNLVYLHVNYNTFRLAFWVLNNILACPKSYESLTSEIDQAVQDHLDEETGTATFNMTTLESLKVLDSVINESMRLASGVFMVRYVTEDTWFETTNEKKFLVRAGDRVAIYPPAVHKDPEIFEDPQVFKYDRFVDAKFYKNGKELTHPIMAFGSLCPGKRYAMLQLRWYVVNTLTRYNLQFPEGKPAEYDCRYHGHEILPPVADVDCLCLPRSNAPHMEFVRD